MKRDFRKIIIKKLIITNYNATKNIIIMDYKSFKHLNLTLITEKDFVKRTIVIGT